MKTKDEIYTNLQEFYYLMGADQIIEELTKYMSIDELNDFWEHLERHYDLYQANKDYEAAWNTTFNEELPF